MNRSWTNGALAVALLSAGGLGWGGCGDDANGVVFVGNVSDVSGTTPSARVGDAQGRFAFSWPSFPSRAWAENAACAAPSGGALLFCVGNDCTEVDPDFCDFALQIDVATPRSTLVLRFVDDANRSGAVDMTEVGSQVIQALSYCNGDRVRVANSLVNFTTQLTAASVTKTDDACGSSATATPGRTPTPGGPTVTPGGPTVTPGGPTVTPGPGAPTPTPYSYGASLNVEPGSLFAMLAGMGVVGLVVPRRRRGR